MLGESAHGGDKGGCCGEGSNSALSCPFCLPILPILSALSCPFCLPILPILSAKGDTPCVLVPPIPRYLFSRCCDDIGHCTNAKKDKYQEELLSGFLQLCNSSIKMLVMAGLKNFKVLDTCCTTTCATTANTKTRLTDLKMVTAKDGVHYVAAGYRNLASRSISCLKTLLASPP
jgi:lysophospholipase L1-like esterase